MGFHELSVFVRSKYILIMTRDHENQPSENNLYVFKEFLYCKKMVCKLMVGLYSVWFISDFFENQNHFNSLKLCRKPIRKYLNIL